MNLDNATITIFGGSGFIGRHLVQELCKTGAKINILTRSPNKALFLKTCGSVGQINLVTGSIKNKETIKKLISVSDIVINLVGILYEKNKFDFIEAHAKFPELVANLCNQHNVKKLIHISALGADINKTSKYADSKLKGEEAVIANFPKAIIIRPSVIIGRDDSFINKFDKITNFFPIIPLFGGGKTKFQPCYVGDIVKAITKLISSEQYDSYTYELGGPEISTFKEVMHKIFKALNKKILFINIPYRIAKLIGLFFELMPFEPLITRDQIELLKTNNLTQKKAKTFFTIDLQPKSLSEILDEFVNNDNYPQYHHEKQQ